jgi:secreted trypsin-like serine protease
MVSGSDDVRFVRELRRKFLDAHMVSGEGALRIVRSTGRAGDTGHHIYDDPRFAANARTLALRHTGGLRVMGGSTTSHADFPDCVAVGNDTDWGCTGTLIAPTLVVTAGHCAEFATRVFFGSDVTKKGTVVKVKKRIRHPSYHKGHKHNDLLLLVLAKPVTNVAARKIASSALIEKATDGRVVGFGATDESGTFGYGMKRQVDIPIASPSCSGSINGEDDSVTYGCDVGLEIVAGKALLARDSCNGDSGGPFYVAGAANKWLLAGATSRSTDSATHNCGDGGVYVRVDRYRAWIEKAAGVKLP